MQKKSAKIETQFEYERIIEQIGDIGLVEMGQNKALINLYTGEVKGIFRGFPEKNDDFFILIEEGHDERGYANFITIYDAINEEYVVRRARLVEMQGINDSVGQRLSRVLIEVAENEYRLFDIKNYRTKQNSFAKKIVSVEFVGDDHFVLSDGTKKAIYSTINGLMTDYDNDAISYKNGIAVLTKNGRDSVKPIESVNIKTESESYAKINHASYNVILCQKDLNPDSMGEQTYEVYVGNENLYRTWSFLGAIKCEDIAVLDTNTLDRGQKHCLFKVKNNGKWTLKAGISSLNISDKSFKLTDVLSLQFDKIENIDNKTWILEANGKFGLCKLNIDDERKKAEPYIVEPIYEKVEKVKGTNYALLYTNGEYSIIDLRAKKVVASDVESAIITDAKSVIYKKDSKFGILYIDGKIQDGFDNVKYLGNDLYLVTKNNMQGVLHGDSYKIESQYVSIDLVPTPDYIEPKPIMLKLGKPDGTYELSQIICNEHGECESGKISENSFNEFKFFDRFIVCISDEKVEIYDYRGHLKGTYAAADDVEEIIVEQCMRKDYGDLHYYCIGGKYYNADGKEVNLESAIEYIAAYESPYGIVAINSFIEEDYNEICGRIDAMSQEEFDQIVAALNEAHPRVKEDYPQLTMGVHPAMKNEE